ncbi:cell division protein FtsQ/DivIB [Methylotenera sp.]|uniref:cell division protein FtsQ/DivIB n=1 Tax=Methylotenera sp. TaxID=2051956 RepID=UPI00271F4607|nr:cell division protein FtsQ/DivIB [Methylotenera sp.]MDO9206392.1 cell division protein FtsQ/DivIB [Methylotenera sp.]MDP2070735.1 cell division protein FtsQ/DivIB [Methylotenera sp.]MDP2231403.1 cell division protein FtsQ/DivIB [Methylotenera sp.]MDP3004784.1 cell division protein FtsQ/DivIB [Methylotenera sp.]MDP3140780.1 cell division protein FtsQ/DivIB [Methylotenera sp.]
MWDKPTLLNWIANLLFAVSIVVMLYAALYVVVHLPIFPLREVKVEGQLNHVNREQVKLIVAKHLKGNFFTLDLIKARDAFEKLPWARSVSVRRRWPDKLEVVIEEHQALARWGNVALVNTHGELFHAASGSELPMFYGPGDGVIEVASQYAEFSKVLKDANLAIANLALTPRRAWQVTTTDGMVVELGRVEMQRRLEKFVSAYSSTIAGLNMKVTYVDLRYPNGFAVRRPAEAKPLSEDKNSAKATGVSKASGNSKTGGTSKANENKLNSTNPAGTLQPGNKKPAEINKQQT